MIKLLTVMAAGALFCACGGSSNATPDTTPPDDDGGGETSSGDGGDGSVDSVPVEGGEAGIDALPSDPTDRSKCTIDPDKIGLTKREVKSPGGGTTYTYAAYAPAGYDPSKLTPLLIALHGASDTADGYLAAIWRANADTRGFLVLAAEGSSKLGAGFTYSSTDARYIANELLTDFARCYTVDPKKRVLNGFAAGGVLAYSIGLGGSAKDFAGIAIASSDFGAAEVVAKSESRSLLPAAWLIPISHTHGTSDSKFPIASARAGRDKLIAAGHKVSWHEFEGANATDPATALTMWDELAASVSP